MKPTLKTFERIQLSFILILFACLILPTQALISQYDIVLSGGRVMDPETKLDEIRNIGITDGKIMEISSDPLNGTIVIDVAGLVVSPGFIDLHVHGITNVEQEYQAHDGVTTALELEWGLPLLKDWYNSRKGKAMINYGASVNWPFCRFQNAEAISKNVEALKASIASSDFIGIQDLLLPMFRTFSMELPVEQHEIMLNNVRKSLEEGGLGIGVPVGYLTGATREEVYRVYQLAGELQAPVFTHIRDAKGLSVQQAISHAVLTDAPLHIVHMNSMALGEIGLSIEMVNDAQEKGFDITTEVYPYTAASTGIETAIFDEGWQERLGISYGDVQWVATGERLTEKTFNEKRATGGTVIIHMMKPDWITHGIKSENVTVASDGMWYAELAHPRTAGTYSRVLGKYVREDQALDLMTALKKMTLLPAKRMETIAPIMRFKGRLQVGMDADITVFDPDQVIDKATFDGGLEFSEGIHYVMDNGVLVLDKGETIMDVFPGKPVYGKYKR